MNRTPGRCCVLTCTLGKNRGPGASNIAPSLLPVTPWSSADLGYEMNCAPIPQTLEGVGGVPWGKGTETGGEDFQLSAPSVPEKKW